MKCIKLDDITDFLEKHQEFLKFIRLNTSVTGIEYY